MKVYGLILVPALSAFYNEGQRARGKRIMKNSLKNFRIIGLVEGGSLLILLFIAMPLKYFVDIPEAVSVVGAIHGGLFSIYILFIAYMTFIARWPFRFSVGAFAAAFIPFGNFILDKRLGNWKQTNTSENSLA